MTGRLAFAAALLFLAAPLPAAPAADEPAKPGLTLSLKVEPVAIKLDAPIKLTCTFHNETGKAIQVPAWGLMDVCVALRVADARGGVLPVGGGRDASRELTANDFPILKAGESKEFALTGYIDPKGTLIVHELAGGIWTWKMPPGKYTLTAMVDTTHAKDAASPFAHLRGESFWIGETKSAGVLIEVQNKP
jgi:hypothetical protein